MESENLLQEVRSFVSASKSQDNVTVLERSKSAIILMRSLPCARAAVLEQICEIFQQAVHKHIIESDRQDLLGTAQVTDVDSQVYEVIQSIYDTLLEFINKNHEAWAPIIAKWSVYLLGQLSTKYAGQRGTKPNVTLNEKLQIWMTCPAIQMLMEISAQCFSKLINSNPDVCINCLLDSAVKHSPHFDWVVAYIGSYFYKSIINRLLSGALKEFQNNAANDDQVSLLLLTAIRILDYLAIQYPEEVKNSILAMFQESVTSSAKTICLVPFLIHLGTHAPSILNVLAITFLDQLSPNVMVKLYFQLSEWGSIKGNLTASLLSSVVNLIISLKQGNYKVFQFLLAISLNIQSSDITEPEASRIINNIQKFSTILLEQLFVQLQRLVWKKHQATSSSEGFWEALSGSKESSHDISFINEIKERFKDICDELTKTDDKNRLSWYLRLLSLVAIYSGPSTSVEILNYIFTFRGTSHTLSLFIQVQKELQSFFPRILDQALEKCLKNIATKSSPDALTQAQIIVQNLQKLMDLEKISEKELNGFSLSHCIKKHSCLLVSFLFYPSMLITSVTLDVLLTLGFPLATMALSDKTKIVRTFVSFLFNLLHEYKFASLEKKCDMCFEYIEMLRRCQLMLTLLCQDEFCQLLAVRHLMEGACHEQNKRLFNKEQTIEIDCNLGDDNSLFNRNLKPGISSRLPLNTASVFYFGIIGKGLKISTQKTMPQASFFTSSHLFLQSIYNVCYATNVAKPNAMETDRSGSEVNNAKILGTLSLLLRDLLVQDGSFDCNSWPDDEIVKYSIERDIKIRKQFDDSEIMWYLLYLVAEVPHVLLNCISIIHGLFSSVVKFWEQDREPRTTATPSHLYASVQIIAIMRKAMWLPKPLCLIGEIFHIISPKEVHKLLTTTWEFLKENPPNVNTRITTEIKDDHHKDVVKSIFLGNIAELGHLYARFFPVNKI